MSSVLEKRVKQIIQDQSPHRPFPVNLTFETLALCEVIADMKKELAVLRKKVFNLSYPRGDGA